jgi:hypothetical protein
MRSPLIGIVAAAVAGIIFGIGLAIARMTDPQKIKDFLDIAAIPQGGWDPSLIFVMAGAAFVAFFGLRLDRVLRRPLAAQVFVSAEGSEIDRPLLAGAALFGAGWGLSGLCPGPAIADLGLIPSPVLPFVLAMLAGSWLAGALPTSFAGQAAARTAGE